MAKQPTPIRGFVSRDHILSLPALEEAVLEVPEWGGNVLVREMTAGSWDRHRKTMMEIQRDGKASITIEQARARVVTQCVFDEGGALLFESGDAFKLAGMGNKVISRVYNKIEELSTFSEEEAKAVAENLEETNPASPSST